MGALCDDLIAFLWYGKPDPDTFLEIQRETGSSDVSQINTGYSRIDFYFVIALARRTRHLPVLHCLIFDFQKQDCMNFSVQVKVMPLKELLDPQGKAVMGGLQNLGIKTIQDVRIGKTIQLQVDAATADDAKKIAEEASKKLLANPVMEYFEIAVL